MPDHADPRSRFGFPLPLGEFGDMMAEAHMNKRTVIKPGQLLFRTRLGALYCSFEDTHEKLVVFKVVGGAWVDETDALVPPMQQMSPLARLAFVASLDDPSSYTDILPL